MKFHKYDGETGSIIGLFNAMMTLNVLASMITIWMIFYGLSKRNGYTKLILYMTIAQMLFDTQLFLFNFTTDDQGNYINAVVIAELFLGISLGVATALYALTICLIMAAIVKLRQFYNLEKNLPIINFVITVIGLAQAIPAILTKHLDKPIAFKACLQLYDITRLTVIALIVVILLLTYVDLRNRGEYSTNTKSNPIMVMVSRLSMYPLVQVVSRLPVEVYQLMYHKPLLEFVKDSHPPDKLVLIYISVLTVGFGGIGNMVVFFVVQPEARACIRDKIRLAFLFIGLAGLAEMFVDKRDRVDSGASKGSSASIKVPLSKSPQMNAQLQSFYKKNNSLSRESGLHDSFSDLDVNRPTLASIAAAGEDEVNGEGGRGPRTVPSASRRRISEFVENEEASLGGDTIPGETAPRLNFIDEQDGNYDDMDEDQLILHIVELEERRSIARDSINASSRGSLGSAELELGSTINTGTPNPLAV